MLTVVGIKSSSIQNGYYFKQDGGYYIEELVKNGLYQWFGKAAEKLGLQGSIEIQDHIKVFNGILPGGIEVGKRNPDGILNGRPGYDLTFSMNKDLSLIICCSKNKELRQYFLDAHVKSVKIAMVEVEKMVLARKTVGGITHYEPTKNMVAALFTHFSSRAGDPQVHTHACVANVTQRADGQWRALATDMQRKHGFYEKIRDNATYIGHIYQNEMALAAKEKGFKVERVNKHGMFEIKSFPDDIRKHFSKRREQIEKIVSSLENADKNDKKLFDQVAQNSRASKQKISKTDFMLKSKHEMQSFLSNNIYNKNFDQLLDVCTKDKALKSQPTTIDAKNAISDAISSLSTFSVKLDANKIIEKAVCFDLGGSSTASLQSALDEYIKTGKLLKTSSDNFTTPNLVNKENHLTASIKNTLGGSILSVHNIKESLLNSRLCIVKEPKSLEAKLATIDNIINDLESNGKKVRLLTQTKSMASSHNEHLRSQKTNLWQQLKRLGKLDRAESLYGFLYKTENDRSNPLNNIFAKKGKQVWIVEDSQRISIDAAQKLIDLSQKRHTNIIFLSFNEGRRSCLAGNALSIIEKAGAPCIKPPSTTKTTQKSKLTCKVHEIKPNLNTSNSQKNIIRQQRLASNVVQQYGNNLSKVEVFGSIQKSAATLSQLIRDELKSQGIIKQENHNIITQTPAYLSIEEKKHAKFFKVGMLARTYVGNGVFNEKVITRIDDNNNRLLVCSSFGREKYLSPAKLLESSETRLYTRKTIEISSGDRIRINTDNKHSKQLGLSINTGYQVEIRNKKVFLTPDNSRLKPIKVTMQRLNGIDLSYDYTKNLNQNTKLKKQKSHAILDAPAYTLNKNIINEFARSHRSLEIYTDNQKTAEKRIENYSSTILASNLDIAPAEKNKTEAQKAVAYGLSIVASREAAFSYQTVIEKSLSYSLANASFKEIRAELIKQVKSKQLHVRENSVGDILLATPAAIELEKTIIDQIKRGKNSVTPFMQKNAISAALKGSKLTTGQRAACTLLASTTDRFVMVQGYAGTGKSTMLETLKRALENNTTVTKDHIIALAPTHKAVKELQAKGLDAQTLKSFLINEQSLEQQNSKHLDNKLILLDESSMVSNKDFKDLQSIVEQSTSCRCAYIGDIAQLSPVEAGKPSELAYISKQANLKIATMNEVLRQKNPKLKAIANDLMQGSTQHVNRAFNNLEQQGFIKEDQDPIKKLAETYTALSPVEREQTLVAIATNENRQLANQAIRRELINKKELTGFEITSSILIDSRLTDTELRHSMNFKVGDVLRLNNQYLNVKQIHHDRNTLELKNNSGENKTINLDLISQNTTLELFHHKQINIQVGDKLKWTKSDNQRDVIAHESLNVTAIDQEKQQITAKNESDQDIIIDLKQRQNQHIDYRYTSTVHGLQAATSKNVMILLDSKNKKSNTMRLMYVATTRATDNVMVYTNDKAAIQRQISQNKGGKTSALEAMALLDIKNLEIKTCNNAHKDKPQKLNLTHQDPSKNKVQIDAKALEKSMRSQIKNICENLLGKPKRSLSSANNWRYGNKGSLSIIVSGQHQGSFHNFETGEKGGAIQLLMSEMGMDFKSALEQGRRMIGDSFPVNQIKPNTKSPENPTNKESVSTQKMAYIDSLIKQSVPIKGTIAEQYLLSRGIKNQENRDLRMLKKVSTGAGNKEIIPFASALLAIARDKNGTVQAIQMTYLDPIKGNKLSELPIKKRTIGSLKEAFVDLNKPHEPPKITIVAEGIETALSINDALNRQQKDQVQLLASLGKSNLANLAKTKSADNIVLALDNDKQNWRQDQTITKAISTLKSANKQITCIQPKLLNDRKTDYNDLAQAGKSAEIKSDLKHAFEQFSNKTKTDCSKQYPQDTICQGTKQTSIENTEREIAG